LIGGAVQVEVTHEEVEELLLEGFLPRVDLAAKPAPRRSGFQDSASRTRPTPAITRYLAAFLTATSATTPTTTAPQCPARPRPLQRRPSSNPPSCGVG